MINDGIEICLMAKGATLPACIPGRGTHEFRNIESPEGNRSGWHVDQCRWCGVKQSYDTSD